VRTRRWTRRKHAAHLGQVPMTWRIESLQMFLRSAGPVQIDKKNKIKPFVKTQPSCLYRKKTSKQVISYILSVFLVALECKKSTRRAGSINSTTTTIQKGCNRSSLR
jgi:hypothetical protein